MFLKCKWENEVVSPKASKQRVSRGMRVLKDSRNLLKKSQILCTVATRVQISVS